ncbi:MAG: SRPBCC family protein [Acidimicrobiales bacterium]
MTIIATAAAQSIAPPSAFFERWRDVATWPEWNHDTEWVRLDGPFVEHATGVLKPKGGPKVRFVIERLVDGEEFVDVSMMPGAKLRFEHRVRAMETGCALEVTISISGPLARIWRRVLGSGFVKNAQPDLDRLVAVAERAHAG